MKHVKLLLITLVCCTLGVYAQDITSGDPDIDRVRRAVKHQPTTESDYRERVLMLYMWMGSLQQQGAATRPFFDLDSRYYQLQSDVNRQQGGPLRESLKQMCLTVDAMFEKMEGIQKELVEKGPMFEAFESEAEVKGGDYDAEWPMFQANKHNNGATTAPGPSFGREKWKFPVGLGWYARPVIEGNRVYIASPGMRVTSFCLDLKTGSEIWKSSQNHPRFGIYKYPAIASTPLLINDQVVLREINSHGGNEGQARNLVYLNKETGKTEARRYAGHIDYRTRYAAVTGNDEVVVYPFGVHDIYSYPAICQNLNRLICADAGNQQQRWDFNVGDIDALAEPVISGDKVFQGTMEGYLYALILAGGGQDKRIAWKFRAAGSVNGAVAVESGRVYFGSNGGSVYCLDETDGKLQWEFEVIKPEKGARKHFATPVIHKDRIFVGGADKQLYCLDAINGELIWQVEADDWIRSRPVVDDNNIHFATISGRLYNVNHKGEVQWKKEISHHAIYADLVCTGEELLITDSNLKLYCLDKKGNQIWEKSILAAFSNEQGERIYTDQLSGGTFYQSKPTAAEGKLFFGTPGGFLYSVDAETGEENWKFEMGGAISVGAALANGKVYAGQQGGERFFYCLDAQSGELVWKQTVPGGWVWGSATVDDGLVYVPTVNGYAVCLDGETGHIIWMYPTAKSVPAEPAVDGDLVYFGSWSRALYAFNKKTGEIVWKENGVGLDSGTLIAEDGKIYLPHHANMFTYFDAGTGELLNDGNKNEEEKGIYSDFNASPAFVDGMAFFTARVGVGLRGVPLSSKVFCVDPESGKIHWTFPDGGGLSAPALASGRVYIASGNTPFFYCLDQKSGTPHWIFKLGHRVEESTLCIYRNKVYVLSADGYVHAIE
ncbi:MAG: PQQ-binding-like beta-propeller repeat protein [Bacteroidetes bacterium]|nr:PQQ-binding-like beta-propeller repeat protein [Bacteroidota bacterium]